MTPLTWILCCPTLSVTFRGRRRGSPRDQHGHDQDEGAGEADGPPIPPVPAPAPADSTVRRMSLGSHPAGPTGHPTPSILALPPSPAADSAVPPAPLADESDHDMAGAAISSLAVGQRGPGDVSGKNPSTEPASALPVSGSSGSMPAGAVGVVETKKDSPLVEEQRGGGRSAVETGDPREVAWGVVSAGSAGTGWVVPPSSQVTGEGRGLPGGRAVPRTGMPVLPVGATSAALALRQRGGGDGEALGGVYSYIGADNRSGHEMAAAVAPSEEPVIPPDAVHDGGSLSESSPAVETARAAGSLLGRRQYETAVADRGSGHLSEVEAVADDVPHALSQMLPGVPTSVEGTHLPIAESEARAGPSLPPVLSGDVRSSIDEGSRWAASRAPPPHPRLLGVGSSWESSLEGEHLVGYRYDYLGSAVVGGGTGNARSAGGDRSEIVSLGTALSGDRRQVVLAAEAAASTALGERGNFEGCHAAHPADSGSGVVDRRVISFGEETRHDGQSRFDQHPSGQLPGTGFTARRGGPVFGLVVDPKQHRSDESSLGLGREGQGVPKPPPRSAVPLKTKTLRGVPPEVQLRRPAGGHDGGMGAVGVEREVAMVDRGEWEALRRENKDLRRQVALSEKR